MAWLKPVKVGKTERYELGLSGWLDGESIISHSVQACGAGVVIKSSGVTGSDIWFYAEGVTKGSVKIIIEFATVTRSDSYTERLQVAAADVC